MIEKAAELEIVDERPEINFFSMDQYSISMHKKPIVKGLKIRYESPNHPKLMCVVTNSTQRTLIVSLSLKRQNSYDLEINEYIGQFFIEFFINKSFKELISYHFTKEDLSESDHIVEQTDYYCRIKKTDIQEGMIIFDFIYESEMQARECKKVSLAKINECAKAFMKQLTSNAIKTCLEDIRKEKEQKQKASIEHIDSKHNMKFELLNFNKMRSVQRISNHVIRSKREVPQNLFTSQHKKKSHCVCVSKKQFSQKQEKEEKIEIKKKSSIMIQKSSNRSIKKSLLNQRSSRIKISRLKLLQNRSYSKQTEQTLLSHSYKPLFEYSLRPYYQNMAESFENSLSKLYSLQPKPKSLNENTVIKKLKRIVNKN